MGRGYIVEDAVEKYLTSLQLTGESCLTGLLIGQCSSQRDFVVLAVQTPHRESGDQSQIRRVGAPPDDVDIEWVTEHARQVSRMLPGGLSVLGLFLITTPNLSKEAQNILRRLAFAVDKHTSKGRLWDLSEEDVTDRVTLHICSKTRKAVCKTFDVKDPKCSAKPADWKYQSGVSASWPVLTCNVELDLQIPLAGAATENVDRCIKEGLRSWAKQIEGGCCLINGRCVADDSDLISGPAKKNVKMPQQTLRAQILVSAAEVQSERSTATVQKCTGSLAVRGVVHSRAYTHTNKPKAKNSVEAIKRDIMNTVSCRVEMFLEDLLMNEGDNTGPGSGQLPLPCRVFCPLPGTGVCVCDYMFPDESATDVVDRVKEMLDCAVPEQDVDASLEPSLVEVENALNEQTTPAVPEEALTETPSRQSTTQYYAGVALAAGIALLATATSLLYLSE